MDRLLQMPVNTDTMLTSTVAPAGIGTLGSRLSTPSKMLTGPAHTTGSGWFRFLEELRCRNILYIISHSYLVLCRQSLVPKVDLHTECVDEILQRAIVEKTLRYVRCFGGDPIG